VKVSYEKGHSNPVYHLQPESNVECRFLTILRDMCLLPSASIKVTGSTDTDATASGLHRRPVAVLGIEIIGGKVNLAEVDPSKPVQYKESSVRVKSPDGEWFRV
jgi:hypothetical protein